MFGELEKWGIIWNAELMESLKEIICCGCRWGISVTVGCKAIRNAVSRILDTICSSLIANWVSMYSKYS